MAPMIAALTNLFTIRTPRRHSLAARNTHTKTLIARRARRHRISKPSDHYRSPGSNFLFIANICTLGAVVAGLFLLPKTGSCLIFISLSLSLCVLVTLSLQSQSEEGKNDDCLARTFETRTLFCNVSVCRSKLFVFNFLQQIRVFFLFFFSVFETFPFCSVLQLKTKSNLWHNTSKETQPEKTLIFKLC